MRSSVRACSTAVGAVATRSASTSSRLRWACARRSVVVRRRGDAGTVEAHQEQTAVGAGVDEHSIARRSHGGEVSGESPPTVAFGGGDVEGATGEVDGDGDDRLAVDGAAHPVLLLRRPVPGDRHRGHERPGQRHRCHAAAVLLEQAAQLDRAAARPAGRFRKADAEQAGGRQRRPQRAVDRVVGGLDGEDPGDVDLTGEDVGGEPGDRLLVVGEGEVHQAGANTGRVRSSPASSQRRATAMPISTASGPRSTRLDTRRVPSSSSMSATSSG